MGFVTCKTHAEPSVTKNLKVYMGNCILAFLLFIMNCFLIIVPILSFFISFKKMLSKRGCDCR